MFYLARRMSRLKSYFHTTTTMIQENLERSRNPLDKRQLSKTQYEKKDVENVVLGGIIPVAMGII
jgi:hypothetical protein